MAKCNISRINQIICTVIAGKAWYYFAIVRSINTIGYSKVRILPLETASRTKFKFHITVNRVFKIPLTGYLVGIRVTGLSLILRIEKGVIRYQVSLRCISIV